MERTAEHERVNGADAKAFERLYLHQSANVGNQLAQWGRAPYR